jgi:hypothetical protein
LAVVVLDEGVDRFVEHPREVVVIAFLFAAFGKPFTSNRFGNWFRKQRDEAGLKHCSAHGLRKAGAALAGENGATERQLMAIFGWTTMKEASRYTRAARHDGKPVSPEASILHTPNERPRVTRTPERTETMTHSLKEKLTTREPARRVAIEGEADRLHEEYLTRDEQRTSDRPT